MVSNQKRLFGSGLITLQNAPESLVAYECSFDAGYQDPPHTHERPQLSVALTGVMTIIVEDVSYVLPPNRAIWIPKGMKHQTICKSDVNFQYIFIAPELVKRPNTCRVFETTPLVRAVIDEITSFDPDYAIDSREGKIVDLLLGEIENMSHVPVSVPMPKNKNLRLVCETIIANPADPRNIDQWAKKVGMARRTFTRMFSAELGMGLSTWRTQVRLIEAASRIASGEQIANVAFDIGYENPSYFSTMFRRTFGENPSTYCRR